TVLQSLETAPQAVAGGFDVDTQRIGPHLDREAFFVMKQEGGALVVRQFVEASLQPAPRGKPGNRFVRGWMRIGRTTSKRTEAEDARGLEAVAVLIVRIEHRLSATQAELLDGDLVRDRESPDAPRSILRREGVAGGNDSRPGLLEHFANFGG